MIKPFVYYIRENLAVKSFPNPGMARSLIEKGEIRLGRIKKTSITEEESSIVFEEIYECLREMCQSLMELEGFKPYSHEALISFVKERNFLSEEKVTVLDNYRILRNNSVYKAEKVSLQKCLEALQFAKGIAPELKVLFERLKK